MIGETPLAFGNYDISMTIPPSAREVEVSQYMQGNPFQDECQTLSRLTNSLGAWVAFAKDPRTGLSNYGWPQFSFDGRSPLLFCFLRLIIRQSQP